MQSYLLKIREDPISWRLYVEETKKNGKTIIVRPLDPSTIFKELKGHQWIMISGSMQPKWYLEKVLGIENFEPVDVNPFKPNISYFIDRSLTFQRGTGKKDQREDNREVAVDKIMKLQSSEGITIVMTQSKKFSRWFDGKVAYVEDKKDSMEGALKRVNDVLNKKGKAMMVCYAHGKFVEGIEIIKDGRSLIKRVILLGVPYPNLSSEYSQDVIGRIAQRTGKSRGDIRSYMFEVKALTTMKQVIGRAVRNPNDKAEVYLIDSRFLNPKLAKGLGIERKDMKFVN